MCARYAVADEVVILTGGVDLFGALYELAARSPTGGVWVEVFGTVRGASIIELTGDRHRESVREATLSAMTATVFIQDGVPDIRSVATLTWREKRTPYSLTGFLASARATHLTVRFRPMQWIASAADATMDASSFAVSSMSVPGAAPAQESSSAAAKAVAKSVEKITKDLPNKRKQAEAAVASWAEVADLSESTPEPSNFGWADIASAIEETPEPAAAPKADLQASLSWGDVAEESAKPSPAPQPAPESAWDLVAEVSQEVSARKAIAAGDLERGDVLIHPTLGNCTVLSIMSEHVVMVKPKHEASRKITIKPFDVVPSEKKGVYTLVKR